MEQFFRDIVVGVIAGVILMIIPTMYKTVKNHLSTAIDKWFRK